MFRTEGVILQVVLQDGKLRYLYLVDDKLFRENSEKPILSGVKLSADWKFQICGKATIIAKEKQAFIVRGGNAPEPLRTGVYREKQAVFAGNAQSHFWINGKELMRSETSQSTRIGSILAGQTRIWMGTSFGFGYYDAGGFRRAFVFDAKRQGLLYVELPALKGQLLSMDVSFSSRRAWLMLSVRHGASVTNHCFLLNSRAEILAHSEAEQGDDNWLGRISAICAANPRRECLFVATDYGVVEVVQNGSQLDKRATYTGTDGVVTARDHIIWSEDEDGLFVWDRRSIRLLAT